MRIVFVVLAHRAPAHARRLFDRLANAGDVLVHIDRRSNQTEFRPRSPNVRFVADRRALNWGGWTIVDATLHLLRACRSTIGDEDRVVLISGDSYPLQSPQAISELMRARPRAQYLNCTPMPTEDVSKPLRRVSRLHIEYDRTDKRHHVVPRAFNRLQLPQPYRKALGSRTLYGGSQWFALTGAAVHWILSEIDADARLVRLARRTAIPDEWFVHTLLKSSPFATDVVSSLMFTDWSRPQGPRPAFIDHAHVDRLVSCPDLIVDQGPYGRGPVLFARKFPQRSAAIVDDVEARLWPIHPAHAPG